MILSVDDGCASDVRLSELADKYGVETVFYWPVEWHSLAYEKGYRPLSYMDALDISIRHQIGSHTITHRHLTNIPASEARQEIFESKVILENMFRKKIIRFAPPRGYTNNDLSAFTMLHYQSQRLTKGENLVHIHPNSGANDNKPWRECITDKTTELWCHSWELDKYNLWEELESWLAQNKVA